MAKKEKVKRHAGKKILRVLVIILLVISILTASATIVNIVLERSHEEFIGNVPPVEYEEQLVPVIDDDGYYTFTTDREFKIVNITDVHIGAGFLSPKKDNMAMNTVITMITK